jgi:hypothetical protein
MRRVQEHYAWPVVFGELFRLYEAVRKEFRAGEISLPGAARSRMRGHPIRNCHEQKRQHITSDNET